MDKLSALAKDRPVQICAAVMLLAALADWPYGYYTLLRLVVCLAGTVLAWRFFQTKHFAWALGMMGLALLFNPFVLVHFQRQQWAWIDGLAALAFLLSPSVNASRLAPKPSSNDRTG